MKAIVFSDSHGKIFNMQTALNKFYSETDVIIHLGDCSKDAEEISALYCGCKLVNVKGNCDYSCLLPSSVTVSLNDVIFFISHGHTYGVKSSLTQIYYAALEKNADICLFGHTHKVFYEKSGHMHILNPGSISRPKGLDFPTFAVIDFDKEINCRIYGVDGGEITELTL